MIKDGLAADHPSLLVCLSVCLSVRRDGLISCQVSLRLIAAAKKLCAVKWCFFHRGLFRGHGFVKSSPGNNSVFFNIFLHCNIGAVVWEMSEFLSLLDLLLISKLQSEREYLGIRGMCLLSIHFVPFLSGAFPGKLQ